MEAPPSPLSSRAKLRDLRFYRLVLEMFFDRVLMRVEGESVLPTALGQMLESMPWPGWADVRRSALRTSKPTASVKTISKTGL